MSNEIGNVSTKNNDIVSEVDGYRDQKTLHAVNRDGDLYYIECPECHKNELTQLRLFGCKNCHTRFSVYPEDGFKSFDVRTEDNIHSSDKKIRIIRLRPNDYDVIELLPRNYGCCGPIKEKYPHMKTIELWRDYNPENGRDAHGHEKYKKYAIIPLN